jgi:NodT family efflux transporter outer membrane factor (OMF) lipoprotein
MYLVIKTLSVHFLLSVFIVLTASGCASHAPYSLPLQEDNAFSISGSQALEKAWWRALGDEKLNDHIETALNNNFSLGAAWERLNAARAIARRDAADLYPALDVSGSASRVIEDGDGDNAFSAGPAASYELDLWGRIRSEAKAEDLRALASEETYRTAALTLSSDIATTWARLIEAHRNYDLLSQQMTAREIVLDVIEGRFGIGQVRSEDILRQRLIIAALREEQIDVETEIATLEHMLAVLKGEPPQGARYEASASLPPLPPLPATGLPSELLNRRPDIRAALLQIEAMDKDLAAAVRNQYPRITLSASYVSEALSAGNLFSDWITTLAGNIVTPVIDGGQRRAEVKRLEALRNERVQLYGQAVLEAFQEVEDALIREEKQRERVTNLQSRLQLARATVEQIQTGYFNGANDFISLINAQIDLQDIERNLLRARRNVVESRISLYRALAGDIHQPHKRYLTGRDEG